MKSHYSLWAALLATGLFLTSNASAQTASRTRQSGSSNEKSTSISAADKTFVTKAAQGGLAEVEFGKLAQDKAADQKVKDFGQRMVDDHTKANDELKSIASNKGIDLPTRLSAADQAEKDRLEKLSGAAFDRAYMRHMVMDHKKDLAEFERESKMGKDSDIKSFASKNLSTLREHEQMANDIHSTGHGEHARTGSTTSGSSNASNPSTEEKPNRKSSQHEKTP